MYAKVLMIQSHQSDCPAKTVVCGFCSEEFPRSNLTKHNSSCPDFVIPCTHADNGCSWKGPRHTLSRLHILSCPYESIKGFFAVNSSRMATLTDENTTLRCKVEALEGIVQTMRHEMHAAKTALGPWYRPEGWYPPLSHQTTSTEQPFHARARPTSLASSSTPSSTSFVPFGSPNPSTSAAASNALASYFPPEADESLPSLPWLERRINTSSSGPSPDPNGRPYHEPTPHTPVAPINLSTTLEGSLESLRESVVTLSASVDSLARRHDIELRNETLRANEEISRLNYIMNGLRMQVSSFYYFLRML
jgi:outer membrane murein-binding lipoprotein Lpp